VIDGSTGSSCRAWSSRASSLDDRPAIADGRVYTAQQALELKLIDQVGYMDDVLKLARQKIGVDEAQRGRLPPPH
jgi:protease-4